MPSVFTIAGTDGKRLKKPKTDTPVIGFCKTVHNKRTKCSMQLCYVGVGSRTSTGKKSKTGWQFKKGSSRCSKK